MRRLVSLLLTLVVLLAIAGPVQASPGIRVRLDGTELTFDAAPFVENDRTLVPVRALSEALGFTVGWDEADQRITLTRGATVINLWAGSTKVMVNGKESTLEVPVRKVGDRTFIPLRFVAETLGARVSWNEEQQTASVTSGKALGDFIVKGLRQRDQKVEGALETTTTLASDSMPDGAMKMTTNMAITAHIYQNQMLEQVAMQMPGSGVTMVSQVAAVDGKLFAKSGPNLPWTTVGNYNPDNIGEVYSSMGIQGLDAAQLEKDLLGSAEVRVLGTAEVDSAQVLQVRIDLSRSGLDKAVSQLVSNIPGAAAIGMPNMSFQVDHYVIDYFVNPETGFIHRIDFDIEVTIVVKDQKEGGTIRFVMTGGIKSTPVSEPIQWPADLPK